MKKSMKIPDYIKTEWRSCGSALLQFSSPTCNGCSKKWNAKKRVQRSINIDCLHLKEVKFYISTFNVMEYIEKAPDVSYSQILKDEAIVDSEYDRPVCVSKDVWETWLDHWNQWKEIYVNLSWVIRFPNYSDTETIQWYESYCTDHPEVIEYINCYNEVTLTNEKYFQCKVVGNENNDNSIANFDTLKKSLFDEFYEKRYYVHLLLFLSGMEIDIDDELKGKFAGQGITMSSNFRSNGNSLCLSNEYETYDNKCSSESSNHEKYHSEFDEETSPQPGLEEANCLYALDKVTGIGKESSKIYCDTINLQTNLFSKNKVKDQLVNSFNKVSNGEENLDELPKSPDQVIKELEKQCESHNPIIESPLFEKFSAIKAGDDQPLRDKDFFTFNSEVNYESHDDQEGVHNSRKAAMTESTELGAIGSSLEDEATDLSRIASDGLRDKNIDKLISKNENSSNISRSQSSGSLSVVTSKSLRKRAKESCGMAWALKRAQSLDQREPKTKSSESGSLNDFCPPPTIRKSNERQNLNEPVSTRNNEDHTTSVIISTTQNDACKSDPDKWICQKKSLSIDTNKSDSDKWNCQRNSLSTDTNIPNVLHTSLPLNSEIHESSFFYLLSIWHILCAVFAFVFRLLSGRQSISNNEILIEAPRSSQKKTRISGESVLTSQMRKAEEGCIKYIRSVFYTYLKFLSNSDGLKKECLHLTMVRKSNDERCLQEELVRILPSEEGLYVSYLTEGEVDYILGEMSDSEENLLSYRSRTVFDEEGIQSTTTKLPITDEKVMDEFGERSDYCIYSTEVCFDDEGNPISVPVKVEEMDWSAKIGKVISNCEVHTIWKEGMNDKHLFPLDLSQDTFKYWCQRYRLFLRYDEGIKLDRESWYSVTPEMISAHQAQRLSCDVAIDAFCGAGGNAIQLAATCQQVIAVDIDPVKIEIAKHNAKVYGVQDRIQFIQADFFDVASKLQGDCILLSPPWGGIDYFQGGFYDILTLGGQMDGKKLYKVASKITKNIALYLPKNSNFLQITELAALSNPTDPKVDIEYSYISNKLKSLTAYFGELACNSQ